MTGQEIRELRQALGMDPQRFAQVLQVHPTTLYRWEQAPGEIRIEPFQAQLLELLLRQTRAKAQPADLGKVLLGALLLGGAVFALYKLLEGSFGSDTEAEASSSRRRAKTGTKTRAPRVKKGGERS